MIRIGLLAAALALALLGAGCSEREPAPRRAEAAETPPASAGSTLRPRDDRVPDSLEEGPVRPASPAEAVEQIVAAEDAIADPDTPPALLAVAGRVQQLAYRELGGRPGWDRRVRAELPPRLVGAVAANVAARREFRSMHTGDLGHTLPAWRIVRPAPAQDLLRYYRAAEREFGVGWEYLAAINLVETGMGRIRGTSVAGAQGPMQFLPSTWERYGAGDINSPRDAIRAAARYLSANGFTRPGGIGGALWRYNNHPAYVRGVTHLAKVMERRPRAFLGYYHWDIYYLTTKGDVLLPEGYEARRPIPVRRWLERHPQR